jgi:PAS domain S-box-containing protein
LVAQTLPFVDPEELPFLLHHGDWLEKLIKSVEELPFAVSVATARQTRRGFPLVYTNKAFERITLFDRREILGQSCKFLQSGDNIDKDKVAELADALKSAQPFKTSLKNYRKTGEEFWNLITMKPIFDSHGVYSYVIAIQYELADYSVSSHELKLIDDLIIYFSNVLT